MQYKPRFSQSDKPIVQRKKTTLNSFMKHVWEISNTNLHYVDFKAMFGAQLKEMYRPVKLNQDNDSLEGLGELF